MDSMHVAPAPPQDKVVPFEGFDAAAGPSDM